MDTITHALIPVICVRLAARNTTWFRRWDYVKIGLAGALPDILNPHLTLEARMASWSHGLPCWLILSMIIMVCSILSRRKFPLRLALCMSGAYLLHIACDAISGGVDFLYPFGHFPWGKYWVDASLWIPIDIVCMLLCYLLFRILPGLKQRNADKHLA